MGRPKGSKNKPKVDVNAALKEVGPKKLSLKGASKAALSILADIDKGLEADRKAEADEEEPSLEDALKGLGEDEPKKHRGIKQKKMAEQIEWIFEELKNLRNYIQRIDEARLNLPKNESVIPDTDVVSKRKRRIKPSPSTNEEKESESKNETETE